MKLSLPLFILALCLCLLTSCENEENAFNGEYITFTINNDYTYTLELTETQNDGCDFQLNVGDNLNVFNSNCEAHYSSQLFFTITAFEETQNIPIDLNGSYPGLTLEAVLSFNIPFLDDQNQTNLVLFQMLSGELDIQSAGDVGEYIEFEFIGEAIAPPYSGATIYSVVCSAKIIRDN